MELEFHQIDLRYESLRRRDPHRERLLAVSMGAIGQQTPVVVVAQADGKPILVDGFKRLRALKALRFDVVRATCWDLPEQEALLLGCLMRTATSESPFEQGWLLRELRERFGMTLEELARRFDRTTSWASRRVALVSNLPEVLQDKVRAGQIAPDTAMKVLVPLSRDNRRDALRLGEVIARARLNTRQAKALHAGWVRGDAQVRERILADPLLFLRAREAALGQDPAGKSDLSLLFDDLGAMGAAARSASRRIEDGAMKGLLPQENLEAGRAFRQTRSECQTLFDLSGRESADA
jgi:ParB-like chromosome segregation protein Spo0J